MGKFAGFLKRVKNFMFETIPNKVGPALAKGMFAINKFYKKYEPYISAGIHGVLDLAAGPIGGTIAGVVADLGLKRASNLLDKAEWMYNHPGELITNYDTQKQYENKDVIKLPPGKPKSAPAIYDNNNDKPISGKPAEDVNHNLTEGKMTVINDAAHVKQALSELARINAK